MIRVACALAILALVALLGMVFRTSGGTATLYAFVGIPALALAIVLYLAAEGGHVRRLLVRWLGGSTLAVLGFLVCVAVLGPPPAAANPEAPADRIGAAAYARHCASCHGPDGRGETAVGRAMKLPPLTAESVQPETLASIIRSRRAHAAVSAKVDAPTLQEIASHLLGMLSEGEQKEP